MTPTEIELLNLEHQHENLLKILNRLTIGSKEYTSYCNKIIKCRGKMKITERRLKHEQH